MMCLLTLGSLGVFWWFWRPARVAQHRAPNPESQAGSSTVAASNGSPAAGSTPPPAPQTARPAGSSQPAPAFGQGSTRGSARPSGSFPATEGQEQGPDTFPRPVRDVAEAQIALARLGLSSGSVDGVDGPQTTLAVEAFQRMNHLPATGRFEPRTVELLRLARAAFTNYVVTEADLKRLQPLSSTWSGKAQQSALDYETILELVAEKTRAHPRFLRRLNPPEVFSAPAAGTVIQVPDTDPGEVSPCAFIRVALAARTLEVFDAQSNLMAHFPCSIAQRVEKRPAGELHVASIAPNPNYTFDPALFPESPEAAQLGHKLILPPGPNNPVGVAWIGLDKPGYGIHGTPLPEQVGRTESHGCFRLANWNAEYLLKTVRIGTPVYVE